MKAKYLILALPIGIAAVGCGSSDTPQATAEQKKAFSGGPPPSDYMKGINTKPGGNPAGGGAPAGGATTGK